MALELVLVLTSLPLLFACAVVSRSGRALAAALLVAESDRALVSAAAAETAEGCAAYADSDAAEAEDSLVLLRGDLALLGLAAQGDPLLRAVEVEVVAEGGEEGAVVSRAGTALVPALFVAESDLALVSAAAVGLLGPAEGLEV